MKNILIVKLSSIGDVIHALPTLSVLRHNYPQSKITWIVDERAYSIVENHPYLDEVICTNLKKMKLKEMLKLAHRLKQAKYDLVLDLQGLLKSGLISWFTRAPVRLVYPIHREGSSLLATKAVTARPESLHVIQKCLDTARALKLTITEKNLTDFQLNIQPKDEQFARQFLQSQGILDSDTLIGLNPGAAWPTKQWPPELFARLADQLIEENQAKIILFGGMSDLELITAIKKNMQHTVVSAGGKTTLKQLAALIRHCLVFVGSDTGPMHISVAVKTPVVALFGPTDPGYSGPVNSHDQVIWSHLNCSPCFKVKECPQGTHLACMKAITPDMVQKKITQIIQSQKKAR